MFFDEYIVPRKEWPLLEVGCIIKRVENKLHLIRNEDDKEQERINQIDVELAHAEYLIEGIQNMLEKNETELSDSEDKLTDIKRNL